MDLKRTAKLFTLREIRNGVVSISVILLGLALATLTLWASQSGNIRLAGILAGATLIFVLLILLFVVPPLARNAGREASQMNLPFEFTTGGAIMLGLVAVVGFSAWSTGNNLLFLVLSLLLASLLVGFIAGSLNLRRLDVTMRFPEAIFAEHPTSILVKVTNRKRILPAISTVVDVRGQTRDTSIAARELDELLPRWIASRLSKPPVVRTTLAHVVYIRHGASIEDKREHTFPHRGRLLIRHFELSTTFPFGFVRHRRRLPAREVELVVFPKLAAVGQLHLDLRYQNGVLSTSRRGHGQDLISLREYKPRDDPRRIEWKATARTSQLIVREVAADDEKRVTVIFDTRISSSDLSSMSVGDKIRAEQNGKNVVESTRFEAGVDVVSSLVTSFSEKDAEIRLIAIPSEIEYGSGRRHLYSMLRQLAIVEPNVCDEDSLRELEDRLDRILDEPRDSLVFFVTAGETDWLSNTIAGFLNIVKF